MAGVRPGQRATLRERIGNPLQWSSPAKVLLVTAMIAPPLVGLFLRAKYLIVHPQDEPYIDRATLAHLVNLTDLIVVGHPSRTDREALVALRPRVPVLDASGELSRALSAEDRRSLAPVVVLAGRRT